MVMDAAKTGCHWQGDKGCGIRIERTRFGVVGEMLTRPYSMAPTPPPLLLIVARLELLT